VNWIFYGAIMIGVGISRLWRERRERLHGHTHVCPECGTTWTHKAPDGGDWKTARAWVAAHTCPKCGAEQFIGEPAKAPPPAPKLRAVPPEKTPLNVGGAVQRAAVSDVAAATASPATGGGLGPERPAASPKDRDTADHAAGPASPPKDAK
jgi:predicted RNA-binding Zn-ribbon protein involved in translation (DUF1610 family)